MIQHCMVLAAVCFSANTAAAQMNFDDGSFGTGTPPAGNGGSFDDGSFGSGAADTSPEQSGDGGSFGDDQFPTGPGGPATPPPPPPTFDPAPDEPVTPGPAPAPPPPEPPGPTVQIDPQIYAFEARDFGVPPSGNLRQGQFHAPTPTAIPGGSFVSTEGLADAMNQGLPIVLIDVLGGTYTIPGAFVAPDLATPGHFNDRIQQQAQQWLYQFTGGDPNTAIIVFCSDPMCWLSYNGALRAIAAGYQNVYWYRGGLQAWQMAALPLRPAGF